MKGSGMPTLKDVAGLHNDVRRNGSRPATRCGWSTMADPTCAEHQWHLYRRQDRLWNAVAEQFRMLASSAESVE